MPTVIMMHPMIIRYSRPLAERRCRNDAVTAAARKLPGYEGLGRLRGVMADMAAAMKSPMMRSAAMSHSRQRAVCDSVSR